jgi:hypothetical protein
METTPQQNKQSHGVGILTALVGMLVAFLAGIFVGLHPSWIPIKTSQSGDINQMPTQASPRDMSAPTTMPDDDHSMGNPQTHPSPQTVGQ